MAMSINLPAHMPLYSKLNKLHLCIICTCVCNTYVLCMWPQLIFSVIEPFPYCWTVRLVSSYLQP